MGNQLCGEGTAWKTSEMKCVPQSSVCGENSTWNGSTCVGTASQSFCGANAQLQDGKCVGTASQSFCGANAQLQDGKCVGQTGEVFCGNDTEWDSGSNKCTPAPSVCGIGAKFQYNKKCYIDPLLVTTSEICAAAQKVPAGGGPLNWVSNDNGYYCGPNPVTKVGNVCLAAGNYCGPKK